VKIGQAASTLPRKRKVRDVLKKPSHATVYCRNPHAHRRRRAVAVLTNEPVRHLVTDAVEVRYPDTGSDRLLAPCTACPLPEGERFLSVPQLRQALAAGRTEIYLQDIVWEPLAKGEPSSYGAPDT